MTALSDSLSGSADRMAGLLLAPLVRQPAGWRAALLSRVVAIAIGVGLAISEGIGAEVALSLGALAIVAAVACLVDLGAGPPLARVIPVAEACLAAAVVTTSIGAERALLVYLAVPPVIAGLRLGALSVLNAALTLMIAVTAGGAALTDPADRVQLASSAILWVAVGTAVGLLAAVQNRRLRALELLQAPFEPARRAAADLYDATRDHPGSLDLVSTARMLVTAVVDAVDGAPEGDQVGAAVFLAGEPGTGRPLALAGTPVRSADPEHMMQLASAAAEESTSLMEHDMVAVPLRAGDRALGSVVVTGSRRWRGDELGRIQRVADEHAVQLEAALFFDGIRAMAGTEERNRLARDLHDGAIQEIAGIGYLVDDLAATGADPHTREAAARLRVELTRVIRELRHSVFELRHNLDTGDLSTALRSYADHVDRLGELVVHLDLEVTGPPVEPAREAELLRVTQEAVANVRKHAQASNVWIRYCTNGQDLLLTIEDDGVGSDVPRPRDGHYGMHTMAERARRVGGELATGPRPSGGMRVEVRSAGAVSPRAPLVPRSARLDQQDQASASLDHRPGATSFGQHAHDADRRDPGAHSNGEHRG